MLKKVKNSEPIQQGFIVKDVEYQINGGLVKLPSLCLTPACDLAIQSDGNRKSDYVLFSPLWLDSEFFLQAANRLFGIDFRTSPTLSNSKKNDIKSKIIEIVRDDRNQRYFWIYNKYKENGWILDYQIVQIYEYDKANSFKKVYSLKSSYKERVASKYGEYMGRIGTQDFDRDSHIERITNYLFNYQVE